MNINEVRKSINEIRKMYEIGMTLRQIGVHMGCHHEIIRKCIKHTATERRNPGPRPNYAKRKKAFLLREQGMTHREIGLRLGVSKNVACYLADRGADDAHMASMKSLDI